MKLETSSVTMKGMFSKCTMEINYIIYIYKCVYMNIQMHTYVYMCVYMCAYVYMLYYVHMYIYTFMYSLKRCPITLLKFETLCISGIFHISALILF